MKNPDGYGFLTINVDPDPDEVEVRELRGTKYLVAPVVAVAEGLLNGGFLPYREIQKSAPGWNGVPVTVQHPQDDDGDFVPANQPAVLERYQIGRLLNVEASDPKLEGELWVNLAEVKWLDDNDEDLGPLAKEAVRMLREGDPLEVSTGYWHGQKQDSGTFDGHEYDTVQVDLLPDHLAVLPESEGACNWEGSTTASGCGAPRANVDGESSALAAAAADAADGFAFAANDLDIQGEALGNRLEELIEEQTNDDRSREDVIEAMSEAAEVDEVTVNSIARGDIVCPPRKRLEAFAGVLDADVDTLVDAAEDDGCSFGEQNSALQNIGRRVLGALGYPLGDQQPTTNDDDDGVPDRHHGVNCNCGGCTFDMKDTPSDRLKSLAEQTEFSVEELQAMDNEAVETIEEEYANQNNDGGSAGGDGPTGNAGGDDDAPAWAENLTDRVEDLGEQVEDLGERVEAQQDERRERLVETITSQTRYDEDDLDDLGIAEDVDALETFAQKEGAKVNTEPNYAGRAAGTSAASGDDDLEDYDMAMGANALRPDVETGGAGGD